MLVVAVLVVIILVLLVVPVAVVLVRDHLVMVHQELSLLVAEEVAVLEARQVATVVMVHLVLSWFVNKLQHLRQVQKQLVAISSTITIKLYMFSQDPEPLLTPQH